jgi:hypothetical protein
MVNSDEKTSDFPKVEASIAELGEILLSLKKNLCNLHQKIEIIDSMPELLGSIKNYKNYIGTRANKLEAEVKWLREELKAIRDLLGIKLQNSNSGKS